MDLTELSLSLQIQSLEVLQNGYSKEFENEMSNATPDYVKLYGINTKLSAVNYDIECARKFLELYTRQKQYEKAKFKTKYNV